jgi:hypothetical protein
MGNLAFAALAPCALPVCMTEAIATRIEPSRNSVCWEVR